MQQNIEELRKQLEDLKEDYNELKQENHQIKNERDEFELLLKNKSNAQIKTNRHSNEFWKDIEDKLRKNKVEDIKHLIQTKQLRMDDVNDDGQTLLIIAAFERSYEIVQFCINLGADVNHKDKYDRTAADIGHYYADIVQLLQFAAMNANIGDRIRNTAFIIKQQKGINENISNQLSLIGEQSKEIFEKILAEIMINIITEKQAFDDCLLNLCLDIISKYGAENKNILHSDLWSAINKTCKDIIENGNKRDWYWMKQYIIPSTIWYRDLNAKTEHEKDDDDEDEDDSDDDRKEDDNPPQYLYYKLLELTKVQESNLKNKLEKSMETEKNKNMDSWNDLVSFDLSDDKLLTLKDVSSTTRNINGSNIEITKIRQDNVPNGILSSYTFNELTEQFTTSSSFNSHKFYDYNQYLSELQLNAEIVDDEFHKSIQNIFNINKDTKIGKINIKNNEEEEQKYANNNNDDQGERVIVYRRGPVKLMSRARNKAENDYYDQIFPTTACVLDFNRCTLIFNEIDTLLYALNLFANKIKYYQSGNIIAIVRIKNGFKEYVKTVQYADIKLNVLIRGVQHNLIGEVQFLIDHMLSFKTKNHSLYSIQREEEYIKQSISRILPSLLNDKKQIFIASERGDIDTFRNLMVHSNKTDKDIMIYDENDYSVLDGLCSKGYIKTFEYLKNTIERELFLEHLCKTKRYSFDSTAIARAISEGQLLMIQKICAMPLVKKQFKTNDAELFKIIWVLFTKCCHEYLIDFILLEFEITTEKLKQFIDYKSLNYIDEHIINDVIENNTLNVLKKLVSIIGDKAFIDGIYKEIKTKYKNVDDQVCELIYFLFTKCKTEEIIDWVLKQLNISHEQIIKCMDYQHEEKTFLGETVSNELNIIKKLQSIIPEKTFIDYLFVSDGYNKNALEYLITYDSLAEIRYLISIKNVKQKCLMNEEILWRITYRMIKNYRYISMIRYLKYELELNEKKLKELQQYKCSKSFDYDKWGDYASPEEYWNETISDEAIEKVLYPQDED